MAVTPEQFFGKIGVKNGLFTQAQLDECFRIQRERHSHTGIKEPLSYIMFECKLLTNDQAKDLLQEFKYSCLRRDDKEIADIAVGRGYLTREEIDMALKYQRKLFREGVGIFQLGEILISREILSPEQVFELHCELWSRRHKGKPLPPNAREALESQRRRARQAAEGMDAIEELDGVLEFAEDDEIGATSTTDLKPAGEKDVQAMRDPSAGFKVCSECGYKSPHVATLCYGCGEPLGK